ncbi:MAG TPA: tetratricopeptide repeat protein [Terriglobales bacterium]|nr:tetratricopeptide repeat protein [Terriglobales bacterium]
MTSMGKVLCCAALWLIAVTGNAWAQNFEIANPNGKPASTSKQSGNSDAAQSGIGWGSGVEVARQAHAAQDALRTGNYAAAVDYAERATRAAPSDASLWLLLGYAARLAGRYQLSEDAYQHAQVIQPSSGAALSGLAQTYAKMGRQEEARQLLLKTLTVSPKNPEILAFAGELFLGSDPQRALGFLEQADSQKPSSHIEVLMAQVYRRLDQPEQAKRMLLRAKSRAPEDPDVLRAIAGYYRENGQYDEAIASLKEIRSRNPEVQAELAYTYGVAGKQEEAADVYVLAAKAATANIGLQLSAAQSLINAGKPDAAKPFLDRARNRDQKNYRLHAILAQIADLQNRPADAIQEYQLALSHSPEVPAEGSLYPIQLRLALYDLYRRADNPGEANQQLELAGSAIQKIQISDSSRPEFLRLRGVIESASGNMTAADRDMKEALALAPSNPNLVLNYGFLLWKLDRKEEAQKMFQRVLTLDPQNRFALTSLGYLAREMGDPKAAEGYFARAMELHPGDYAPHLALGDLDTALRKLPAAELSYETAYKLMPTNPMVIAGGTNAALEAHDLELAQKWLARSTGEMDQHPQVMRERERYLFFRGAYKDSASLGAKVIQKLPRDPQAPVYYAYDLYYLGRYDEALQLVNEYEKVLPRDKDLALIAGYVHYHNGLLDDALNDFTRALERDPKMATGYVNRGYVLNDLKRARAATRDFQAAIKLRPDYGEAHLGLAYADLQLRRSQAALSELDSAERLLGKPRAWHLARAEAFRQQQRLGKAEGEYRAALADTPNDLTTRMALADTLYQMHRYNDAIQALNDAMALAPGDPLLQAQMSRCYAHLGREDEAMRYIQLAEQQRAGKPAILMTTGDALLTLGKRQAAMDRFGRALESGESDRVATRLAIARVFAREGNFEDARQQISLGFAEARIGEAGPVTPSDLVEAGDILLTLHDFDLARTYFDKARTAGADERVVALGLANSYLAQGNPHDAEMQLKILEKSADSDQDYDYLMTLANVYRQKQDTERALMEFGRASAVVGGDPDNQAAISQFELESEEGKPISDELSLATQAYFAPTFEDINIYTLDARLHGGGNAATLPPPRSSYESLAAEHFRIHPENIPTIEGFVGERIAGGRISFPSTDLIRDRSTFDTIFNVGIAPVVRLGSNTMVFHTGLQFTNRRDRLDPVDMNQNLLRQFVYMETSSFGNWLSVHGSLTHETGPFSLQDLHSRDITGTLEFRVGRPWGNNALITGYAARDLLFNPLVREYFTTSTYVGWQHRFNERLKVTGLAEYLRSWRVENSLYALAQAVRPAVRVEYFPNHRWSVEGSFALSRGQGFHDYDNADGQLLVSYMKPIHRAGDDGKGGSRIGYPLKLSFGVEQQTFYNFSGQGGKTEVLPVFHLTLF